MHPFSLVPTLAASAALCLGGSLVAQDECSQAVPVFLGVNGPFTNVGSTTSSPPFTCVTPSGNDVWFSHVATCSSLVASTCGADYDSCIEVYDGSGGCNNLVSVACNDDTCFRQGEVSWSATVGTTYYIRVGGWSSLTGNFNLTLSCDLGITIDGVSEAVAGSGTLVPLDTSFIPNDYLRWNYNDPGGLYTGMFASTVVNFGPASVGSTPTIPGFYQLWGGSMPSGFAAVVGPTSVGGSDLSILIPPGIFMTGETVRLQGVVLDPASAQGVLPIVPTTNTIEFRNLACAHYESFDGLATGTGVYPSGWSDGGGTFQWRVDASGTPSFGTGPAAGFSPSNYMYCESSSPAVMGDTYIMNTAVYPSAGLSTLDFQLSRNGETMGTLEIRLGDGSGSFPTVLATYSGPALHDPDYWSPESVSLGASLPSNIQLQFLYTRGSSFYGDIAIDDFCLH